MSIKGSVPQELGVRRSHLKIGVEEVGIKESVLNMSFFARSVSKYISMKKVGFKKEVISFVLRCRAAGSPAAHTAASAIPTNAQVLLCRTLEIG